MATKFATKMAMGMAMKMAMVTAVDTYRAHAYIISKRGVDYATNMQYDRCYE
jgi:hypothetical protein